MISLDRLDPEAPVQRAGFHFPHSGIVANVAAAYKALSYVNPALLVTYNWGAIEWALAANFTNIPHIHVVDGFGPDEAYRQLPRRVWFRRAALSRCKQVVVPSQTLERLVREVWRLRIDKITHIPNGIDVDRFARPPDRDLLSALRIPSDQPIIGTVSALRREKNLARLLRAIALLPDQMPFVLLISGEGAERQALESQARAMNRDNRIIFTGEIDDPSRLLGALDLFAISSDTEQMPLSVIEAMAAGLPIAGVDVGDIKKMVSDDNQPFIVERSASALAEAIMALLANSNLRTSIGIANRRRASTRYRLDDMVQCYKKLFSDIALSGTN